MNKIIKRLSVSVLSCLISVCVQAEVLLVGWDAIDSANVEVANVFETGFSGTCDLDYGTNSAPVIHPRSCTDGTFGVLKQGANIATNAFALGVKGNGSFIDFTVTNNGSDACQLTHFCVDLWRTFLVAPDTFSISTGGVVIASGSLTSKQTSPATDGTNNNYDDFDIPLPNCRLSANGSITFRLTLSGGSGTVYIDNAAILGIVPKYVAQMNYRPETYVLTQDEYKDRIDYIKSLGYNTLLLNLGKTGIEFTSPGDFRPAFSNSDLEDIIAYAITSGLEPVIHVRLASKLSDYLSEGFTNNYPDFLDSVVQKTHDPYYDFNGTDVLDGIYKPVIDWIVNSYPTNHPCRYLCVSGDEFNTDDMHEFGASNDASASQAWAKVINDIVNYARTKNDMKIVIWGDKFLSPDLGGPDHGIAGWTPDPRFLNNSWRKNALNADRNPSYPDGSKETTNTTRLVVNYINHKESIIIGDWHYRDDKAIQTSAVNWEYPSLDYFQSNGFHSVWIATWNTEFDADQQYQNARMFTKYGKLLGTDGYIATVWPYDNPQGAYYFNSNVILEDTAKFMKNPHGVRTLSQFSMTNYSKSGWINAFQNAPSIYAIATGGEETSPLVRAAYLYLDVEAGAKGVGMICTNGNTIVAANDFDEEIRITTTLKSSVTNGASVRTFLIENIQNFLAGDYLMIQAKETQSGIQFTLSQSGQTYLNYAVTNGINLSEFDEIYVSIKDNTISEFDFMDANGSTVDVYNILALSGWSGAVASCKSMFPGGAYTMIELLSPSGSTASVKIGGIVVEKYWY